MSPAFAPARDQRVCSPRVPSSSSASSCTTCIGAAAGGSHGTVSWRSSTSTRRIGSPHIAVVQLCSSCKASVPSFCAAPRWCMRLPLGCCCRRWTTVVRCCLKRVMPVVGGGQLLRSPVSPVSCCSAAWGWCPLAQSVHALWSPVVSASLSCLMLWWRGAGSLLLPGLLGEWRLGVPASCCGGCLGVVFA